MHSSPLRSAGCGLAGGRTALSDVFAVGPGRTLRKMLTIFYCSP